MVVLAASACSYPDLTRAQTKAGMDWVMPGEAGQMEAGVMFDAANGRCVDASFTSPDAMRWLQEAEQWQPYVNGVPDVQPPRAESLDVSATYPAELLRERIPGGVMMLLFVEADGSIARMEPLCASDARFVPHAKATLGKQRFHPARMGARDVRSSAMVPLVFYAD